MNAYKHPKILYIHRPALQNAITAAIAVLLLSVATSTSVLAQTQQPPVQPAAQAMPTAITPAASTRPNRNEVIQQLKCARESGELQASVLSSYGLESIHNPSTRISTDCTSSSKAMTAGISNTTH